MTRSLPAGPVPAVDANEAGWHNQPVTITWVVSDPEPSSGLVEPLPADTTANTEGTHTYTSAEACDAAGNCATGSVELSIDLSDPEVIFTGGQSTYRVDQTISITCDASDAVSGLAESDCPSLTAIAGEYGVGQFSLTATAIDIAGNTTTTTLEFTISVDPESLGRLVETYLNGPRDRGIARSLQAKLDAGAYDDFIAQVNALCCTPQRGKLFNEFELATLTRLAAAARDQ